MNPRARRLLPLLLFVLVPLLLLVLSQQNPSVVRGKASSVPLSAELSSTQRRVQDLALADGAVLAATAGKRTEVFTIDYLGSAYLPAPDCDCWQVAIYNFDANATISAIVDGRANEVIDVQVVPGMQPGIPLRLQQRAIELIHEDATVADEIGFQPNLEDIAPMHASLSPTECGDPHLCVAATFFIDERILWAFVDLTDEVVIGTRWGEAGPAFFVDSGTPPENTIEGCPAPGTVNQDGWVVNYETTNSDGFRVHTVTYNGAQVLTSVKLAEWHADYGGFGFVDAVGCAGSGGFPIYPYGDTVLNQLPNGFEIVQDFRMSNWGAACNYRYEQHFRFYDDGRFRVVAGAYGKGCYGGTPANYLPIVRIDVAAGGSETNNLFAWDGGGWAQQNTEFIECPEFSPACAPGPYPLTGDDYRWLVTGPTGSGYFVEPSAGQFSGERGDNQYFYATQHKAAEGDADLGAAIGSCCFGDYRQGPHNFVNGESLVDENLVLWYVPQLLTDLDPQNYYCWTVNVNETYPCFGGPEFTPSLVLDNDTFVPLAPNG